MDNRGIFVASCFDTYFVAGADILTMIVIDPQHPQCDRIAKTPPMQVLL